MTPKNETCARPGCTRAAHNAADRLCWPHRQAAGHTRRNARPARARIESWRAQGAGYATIANHTGIAYSTVRAIHQGQPTTYSAVAEAIAAAPEHIHTRMPPALPIIRRIRALSAAGWTLPALATELEISEEVMKKMRQGGQGITTKRWVYDAVMDAYPRLELEPVRARKGRRMPSHWRPPFAWADGTLDQLPPHWDLVMASRTGDQINTWGRTYQRLDTGWADVARHHGIHPGTLRAHLRGQDTAA